MTFTTLLSLTSVSDLQSELKISGFKSDSTDKTELITLLTRVYAVRGQAAMSALAINLTKGTINAATLTQILREAFPTAKIGPRHGKHYASYSRTGKLLKHNCRFAMAKNIRAAKTGPTAKPSGPTVADLEAQLTERDDLLEMIAKAKDIGQVRRLLKNFAQQ